MKILFSFDGTTCNGSKSAEIKETMSFKEDVLRIYIKGCVYKDVGNGYYFPDLEIIASHVRNAFDEKGYFDLNKFKSFVTEGLYDAGCGAEGKPEGPFIPEEITLEGLSRGAVTTFAVAKKLNELNIPLRVLANQPVTGEVSPYTPLFSKYWDLTDCHNIVTAKVLLATHIDNSFSMDSIYRQMVCRFSLKTKSSIFFLPFQSHFQCQFDSPVSAHLGKALAEWNYLKAPAEAFTQKIHYWYQLKKGEREKSYNFDIYEMSELPENVEGYKQCWIFLKEKNKAYFIRSNGTIDDDPYDFRYSPRYRNYYFTPAEYRQSIFGSDSPIEKDPCYVDFLISKAKQIVYQFNLSDSPLNEEKAAAINTIAKLNLADQAWIAVLIDDEEKYSKLRKIINKTEELCSFLVDQCSYDNSAIMEKQADLYMKTIFQLSYDYFSGNQTNQNKIQFAQNLYKAELHFRKEALSLEPDNLQSVLKVIVNFITHITGIGIVANGINKYLTGNWLLFSHSRSVNIIRDNRREIVDNLLEPGATLS